MQADRAIGSACFVFCLQVALVLPKGFFANKYTFSNLFFLDIYG
jgi:hypothetical protein